MKTKTDIASSYDRAPAKTQFRHESEERPRCNRCCLEAVARRAAAQLSDANGSGARPKKSFINDSGGIVAPQTPGSVEATRRFR